MDTYHTFGYHWVERFCLTEDDGFKGCDEGSYEDSIVDLPGDIFDKSRNITVRLLPVFS